MTAETWKTIPGYSRYSASSLGRIRRDVRVYRTPAGIVSQHINEGGYWSCCITGDDSVSRKLEVHPLVAAAFIGIRPPGLFVCHGPAGKLVNTPSNLRYDTAAENVEDSRRDGTMCIGSRHPASKLTEDDVLKIIVLLVQRQLTHREIGAMFGVDGAVIGKISLGKSWRHIPRPPEMPRRYSVSRQHPAHSGLFEKRETKAVTRARAYLEASRNG